MPKAAADLDCATHSAENDIGPTRQALNMQSITKTQPPEGAPYGKLRLGVRTPIAAHGRSNGRRARRRWKRDDTLSAWTMIWARQLVATVEGHPLLFPCRDVQHEPQ